MSQVVFDERTKIWHGSPVAPLYNPAQGLGELLHRLLARTPTRIAQISADTGRSLTYQQLHLGCIRFAQSLTGSCGLARGDLVTLVARNGDQLAAIVFGCFMAAIPVNTLDPTFRAEDYEHMLRTVPPKAVICDGELVPVLKQALEAVAIAPQLIVIGKRVNGYPTVDDFLLPTGLEECFVPQHVEDPARELAIVLCSSGTTGLPKGVCLSHAICIAHTANLWRATDCDRVLCFSSLYWVSGLGVLLNATTAGATRIITRQSFSARLLIDLVEQYRITTLFTPPAQALALLGEGTIGMADFSSVRLVLCGGGAVSGELKSSFEKYLPRRRAKFIVGYGLSEIGGGCFATAGPYKAGAVGTLNAGMEAKVVDEQGNCLAAGEEGELLVRGKFVFLEYYGNVSETAQMLDREGWLHTGDIARYDEEGMFFVVDRRKDIIKYGGYQVSPSELEAKIMALFAGSVLMVCVTGIPVPGNDLPVALAVRQQEGTVLEGQDIVDGLAEVVSDFKRLRGGVFFVDELPMTPSGKVVRRRCKEMAIALYEEREQQRKEGGSP
uniref:AMP-dependent synthetase/ligase domain-containing protein n=1 Tax=Anopheles quadriannulatus TaxID=34691 RepID=A0A453Z3S0_ANOQN